MDDVSQMNQDPLYQWRKHSGFKKGLATDIVLGDLSKWSGTAQYESTMHSDFNAYQSKSDQNHTVSLIKKGEHNISFGDRKTDNNARFESLTAKDFKPPPADNGTLNSNLTRSNAIERHHRKPLNATSSAHIGLQTRKDLPIDDKHFKCFTTSSGDAYVNFSNQIKGLKDIIKTKGSSIQQGDLNHFSNYTTMQAHSYVLHPNEAYHIQHTKIPHTKTSIVLGQRYNAPRSVGDDDIYTSTSSATYQAKENNQQEVAKPRLNSSIVFGEFRKKMSDPSVTQRDYKMHDKGVVHEANTKTSKTASRNSSGMINAFAPDPQSKLHSESCTALAYKTHSHINHDRSAGLVFGSKVSNGNLSSIPFGDPQGYPIGMFNTTKGNDFNAHYGVHVSHPVLGAKLTKSQVTFGEQGGSMDAEDRYSSTTHLAFVQHPESIAALGRGVPIKH